MSKRTHKTAPSSREERKALATVVNLRHGVEVEHLPASGGKNGRVCDLALGSNSIQWQDPRGQDPQKSGCLRVPKQFSEGGITKVSKETLARDLLEVSSNGPRNKTTALFGGYMNDWAGGQRSRHTPSWLSMKTSSIGVRQSSTVLFFKSRAPRMIRHSSETEIRDRRQKAMEHIHVSEQNVKSEQVFFKSLFL